MGDDERPMVGRKYSPPIEETLAVIERQSNLRDDELREYWCESCDKKQTLTEKEAWSQGWDYPPFMGIWGIVSPRTCGDCGIETTAYWQIMIHDGGTDTLTEKMWATVKRITEETRDVDRA